jgi:uncharacterized protein (DUF1697 family)
MPTHVALLRGINVGGHNKVAMADLRAVVTSIGHTDVATYIQSGNVVFNAKPPADTAALAAELERAIAATLPVSPRVVVRSRDELAQVIRDNPYPDEPNPKAVHAVFLGTDPSPDLAKTVAAAQHRAAEQGSRDTARVVGRTIYLHTPDGLGRSKLAERIRAGDSSTTRNWATVTKLLAMCDG